MSPIFQLRCSQVQVGEKLTFSSSKWSWHVKRWVVSRVYTSLVNLTCPQYRLPEVRYYKGSFILDSEHELTGVQQYRRPRWSASPQSYQLHFKSSNNCRPFWNYQENESDQAYPQVLAAPLNLTSLTYTGDRRRHPDLRMRLYEVLQHKA